MSHTKPVDECMVTRIDDTGGCCMNECDRVITVILGVDDDDDDTRG